VPSVLDVRRICLALPEVTVDEDGSTFRVKGRLLAWHWLERVDPKRRRVPNPDVVVVPVRDELDKQTLLDLENEALFTEPHYDGYAAVLVRLSRIDPSLLEKLLSDAWALQSAKPPVRKRRG
jgi:hypothetical protein